tara:strand:+ start:2891 stop:3574 length:684 start_codon:yes stop_codon:yes gene_type:complete
MNSESLAANEVTDTSPQSSQESVHEQRVYTQEEFDNAMAKMKSVVAKKASKPYEDLGDVEELRKIKGDYERKQQEEQVKRGEFEKILQDLASKKDAEILKRDRVIQEYKVDVPLLNTAARLRSVNPDQVKALLKSQVRLNQEGEVEVIDTHGAVRYNDAGQAWGVEDLVSNFLNDNPHFVAPTPSTTNSRSNVSAGSPHKVDIKSLDMKNPDHRKIYAEHRKTNGLT